MTKTCLGLLIAGAVVTVGTALVVVVAVLLLNPTKTEVDNRNTVVNEEVQDNTIDDEVVDNEVADDGNENLAEGTIVVEAGDGVLFEGEWSFGSYIGESARGLEAYLASGGDSATYEFNSNKEGLYKLSLKLSDDAEHSDDSRSAEVKINDTQILQYVHDSEDTQGWKWYTIGTVNLNEGMNKIVFTKNETTTAAFVMDEFRLEVWGE